MMNGKPLKRRFKAYRWIYIGPNVGKLSIVASSRRPMDETLSMSCGMARTMTMMIGNWL